MLALASTLLALSAPASAQDLFTAPVPSKPTRVEVGLYILDLVKIDGAAQAMSVDFVVTAKWKDPRLAGRPRKVSLDEIWDPELAVLHERKTWKKFKDIAHVDAEGNVLYRQRYWGELSVPLRLDDFPLDDHIIDVTLVATALEPVEMVVRTDGTGIAAKLSIPDWSIRMKGSHVGIWKPAQARPFSTVTLEFHAKRSVTFFLWKIVLPMALIVFMSWAVFWVDPVNVGPQISLAVTSMLTLMAYRVVIGNFLPNLPYLTRMDLFVVGGTLLVFMALIQEVATTYLAKRGNEELPRRIDRWSRWAFPLAFVGIFFVAFVL